MTNQKRIDNNLEEVKNYHKQIMQLSEEDKVDKIYLLSKQLVFIGRLAAIFSEMHRNIYVERKRIYNMEYLKAKQSKAVHAELAIVDIRKQEADAYNNYKRWNTAFITTREEINALKYKVRIDLEDGSSR
ncbi:hypothetical protein SAMN05421839_1395 [Halolactibacillus halophilus]|uniref:Uncharacterized protein n=1 Tax=Halolactibacillus halophilus TaxID=306540 RepID=A0A1I5S4P7_9BACI|nr:hypothetical protein [Halolactibacillus halophilus]GEM02961.1 hypothetical protein HHA03_24930 [Halolactibacillus halophilus]SFP65581.1 hypothetical protein SAMN05421839_1395 [Halolactibacillus halophilus]